MDISRFVGEVPDHFICDICLAVVKNPTEHTDCDRIFCRSCLDNLPQHICPNCRGSLLHKTKDMNRFVREAYEQLKIRCPNEGCKEIFPWPQEEQHRLVCEYPSICPLCSTHVRTKTLEDHQATTCPNIQVPCEVPGCEEWF